MLQALRFEVVGAANLTPPEGMCKNFEVVVVDIPELLVTGCRDTPSFADTYIGKSCNGALKKVTGKINYPDLQAKTLAKIEQGYYIRCWSSEDARRSSNGNFFRCCWCEL